MKKSTKNTTQAVKDVVAANDKASKQAKTIAQGVIVGLPAAMIQAVKAQRATDKLSSGTSKAMLEAAKALQSCDTLGTVCDTNSDLFDSACTVQETFIRSTEARGYRVDKLPRYWTNPKSQIRSAINFGIDLAKYDTESKLRKAVAAKRAELKGSDALGNAIKQFAKQCESVDETVYLEAIKQASAYIAACVAKNTESGATNDIVLDSTTEQLKQLASA